LSSDIAAKSLVNESAETDAGADEVVLGPVDALLLDFLDELPQAAKAVPISKAALSAPARFTDNLMLPPRWLTVATLRRRA
jgi:hypothetical protein